MEKTLGEQRIRTSFNVSGNDAVAKIKNKTAELIDDLQAIKNDEVSKTYELSEEALKYISGEKLRLIALAQTAYEESCMWAEKALTI